MTVFRFKPWYRASLRKFEYSITVDTPHGPADYIDDDYKVIMFDQISWARHHIETVNTRGTYTIIG